MPLKNKINALITDEQRLVSAKTRFNNPICVYDDGFGPLWIHRDSMGITAIVRAMTFQDAYGICEDEFFSEATDTVEEMKKEYGENFTESALWQEAYGFRPNGARAGTWDNGGKKDPIGHGIFAKDLNGDRLDKLTPFLMDELQIKIEVENHE